MKLATVETTLDELTVEQLSVLNSFLGIDGLADAISVNRSVLRYRAFSARLNRLYSVKTIAKRSGGSRELRIPDWRIKYIQAQLLPLLEELYRPSSRVHGYRAGRDIRSNAAAHFGKRLILNVDLEGFFPSISFRRVRGRLMAPPYGLSNQVATAIARLCTCDDQLPIGAPTSPILSNMICSKLDHELRELGKSHGFFYTRYADDLTFSTNRNRFPIDLVEPRAGESGGRVVAGLRLQEIVEANGFQINASKTRLLGRSDCQVVTGVVCNEKLNSLRKLRREIRGAIHAWRKFGKEDAESVWKEKFNWRNAGCLERSLEGKIRHLIYIRGEDDPFVKDVVDQFNALPGRTGKSVRYRFTGGWRDNLYKTVFVIETGNDDIIEYKQGTAFIIENGLVVTSAHNLYIGGLVAPNICGRFSAAHSFTHELEVLSVDTTRDIALLRFKPNEFIASFCTESLRLAAKDAKPDEQVQSAGYPAYVVGESAMTQTGVLTSYSEIMGVPMFGTNMPIFKGNSGGPILDKNGAVIGVATLGGSIDDLKSAYKNFSVPISIVKEIRQALLL